MPTAWLVTGPPFDNPLLPVAPIFVSDGLEAAFRIRDSEDTLVDLSGNDTTLTQVGAPAPVLGSLGPLVGNPMGWRLSKTETPSFTIVAAFLTEYELATPAGGTMQVIGSLSTTDTSGIGLQQGVFSGTTEDPTARLQLSASYYNSSSAIVNTRGSRIALPVPGFPYASLGQWVAITYDDATRSIRIYEPKKGLSTGYTAQTNWHRGGNWHIGYRIGQSDVTGPMRARVPEALFYSRALTELEVMQQFALSEGYLNSIGITLADQPAIADS